MNRLKKEIASSLVELVLVIPLVVITLGAAFSILAEGWADVWRAHRYGGENVLPASTIVMANLPAWKVPNDRQTFSLTLEEQSYLVTKGQRWNEVKTRFHES